MFKRLIHYTLILACTTAVLASQTSLAQAEDRIASVLAKAVVVAVGGGHTCLLTTGGGMKCWGNNYSGILGDGTKVDKIIPVDVSGLTSGVSAIATGHLHTCAVTTGGGAKCWGTNTSRQLGDGTTYNKTTPVDVSGLTSGVSTIAAGTTHTCALVGHLGIE